MKVLMLTNIPSPYRVAFLNEWGRSCDLTAVFERAASSERDGSWSAYRFTGFQGIILKSIPVAADKGISLSVIRYLKKGYDFIIVANPITPVGMLAILTMNLRRLPYLIEGDGPGAADGKSRLRSLVKKRLLRKAVGYLSPSKALDAYYQRYGAAKERIWRYPFTSVWEREIADPAQLDDRKRAARIRLGVDPERKMILAVGSFVPNKGFDVLLRAAGLLTRQAAVYLVGGGEEFPKYREIVEQLGLPEVYILPFQVPEILTDYYLAADVFAFPTRGDSWGLVVNEAMAHGLPVVSTYACIGAVELVAEGENGFLVDAGDEFGLAGRLNRILEEDGLRGRMSANNLEKIRGYTIEEMARRHGRILEQLKGADRCISFF
ncbi:MAG: glycosyltransferase family 4 protein [Clostridium sp.]|jgi:glycosyltransferase involved in cell wall biosynthesis|nr:glycosyltransferase family 4 protein [Clostridium sp.]